MASPNSKRRLCSRRMSVWSLVCAAVAVAFFIWLDKDGGAEYASNRRHDDVVIKSDPAALSAPAQRANAPAPKRTKVEEEIGTAVIYASNGVRPLESVLFQLPLQGRMPRSALEHPISSGVLEHDYVIAASGHAPVVLHNGLKIRRPHHDVVLQPVPAVQVVMRNLNLEAMRRYRVLIAMRPTTNGLQPWEVEVATATRRTIVVEEATVAIPRTGLYGGVIVATVTSESGGLIAPGPSVDFRPDDKVVIMDWDGFNSVSTAASVATVHINLIFAGDEPAGKLKLELRPSPMRTAVRHRFERKAGTDSIMCPIGPMPHGRYEVVLAATGRPPVFIASVEIAGADCLLDVTVPMLSAVSMRAFGGKRLAAITVHDAVGRRIFSQAVEGPNDAIVAGLGSGKYWMQGIGDNVCSEFIPVVVAEADIQVAEAELKPSGRLRLVGWEGWKRVELTCHDAAPIPLLSRAGQPVTLPAGRVVIRVDGEDWEVQVPIGDTIVVDLTPR